MRHTLVALSRASGQPLTGPAGLESWHPRDLASLADILDEEQAEQRRAARKG